MKELLAAIVKNDVSTVRALLRSDANVVTSLIRVPKLYDKEIFHWLYVNDTALHLAAAGYRVEIVQLLLQAGADPNAARNRRKSSPLHYAADGFITGPTWNEERQVKTIRCLVKHGADVRLRDANGATPLHRAVRTRCAPAVQVFLELGADPFAKNKSGSTPYDLAVKNTGRGGSGETVALEAKEKIIKLLLAGDAQT